MNKNVNILIVEDSKDDVVFLLRQLKKDGFQVTYEVVDSLKELNSALDSRKWDLVVSDYDLPQFSGLDTLTLLKEKNLNTPCLIISGKITEDTAVSTMKAGARDYIMKDNLKRLGPAIVRELEVEEVKEKEAYNLSLLDNAPNPILVSGLDTSILYVNSALENLTGYSNRELIGCGFPYPWWPPEKISEYEKGIRVATGSGTMRMEREHRKKNGEPFWVEISTARIQNKGKIQYNLTNWVDITERKKADEALRSSEQRYRSLFENMLNGFAFCRMVYEDGRPVDFIFLMINEAFEKESGLKDVIGKKVTELIPGVRESNPELLEIYGRVALTGIPERFETYIEQTGIWYSISVYSHEKETFIALFSNITERKNMEIEIRHLYEQELQQRKELEEEAKIRGLFINMLAHELKAPVAPMLVSTGLLQDIFSSRADSYEKKIILNLHSSTEKLAGRLEELLEIARYSRGTFKLNLKMVDLNQYFAEVLEHFKPVIAQKDQLLVVDIPQDLPAVEIDPSRLEQVIINLLSNASKFSPEKSRITVKAGKEGNHLVIHVKDEGIGIPPEVQGELFKPYFRVEQENYQAPGLGLGLTVAKQVVELHGGKIWLVSQPGKGSTFSFQIPLNAAKREILN